MLLNDQSGTTWVQHVTLHLAWDAARRSFHRDQRKVFGRPHLDTHHEGKRIHSSRAEVEHHHCHNHLHKLSWLFIIIAVVISVIIDTHHTNSAFHPSGVSKRVPSSAGKAKAGMVHSVSGWTRGVQVKLWDPLRMCAIPERLWGVFTIRCYINHVCLTSPYQR